MGTPLGECLQRGYLVREVLEVAKFKVNKLDCLRGLEPVSPQAQMHGGSWDVLILLDGDGQCSAPVAEGNCRGNTPRH